jgi:putative IMPACT (imprinted ancient) family translation regulator
MRYFGGTLLGVSGLIQAYKTSALEAIKNSKIIEKQIEFKYVITFPYIHLNDAMKLLKQLNCHIHHQQFDSDCEINFSIRKSQSEMCEEKLKKIADLQLTAIY